MIGNYSRNPIKRSLSIGVIGVFFIQSLGLAAPIATADASVSLKAPDIPLSEVIQNPSKLRLPLEYASLKELHTGTNGKLIIHIQDAHSNYSGQMNMAQALKEMIGHTGIQTVLVEGSSSEVTLRETKKIADSKTWKIAANKMLLQGMIAGEEYLNLTTDLPIRLMGIEYQNMYNENLQSYARMVEQRQKVLEYLSVVERKLELLKQLLYPENLKEYEKKISGLDDDEFRESYDMLMNYARQTDNAGLDEYPEIRKLELIKAIESGIDFESANREQMQLVTELKTAGFKEDVSQILESSKKGKKSSDTQQGVLMSLMNLAESAGLSVRPYPNLLSYQSYLESFSELKIDQLLLEINRYEDAFYRRILTDEDARRVRILDRYTRLLRKAFEVKLSSDEFELLRINRPDFNTVEWQAFINRVILKDRGFEDAVPFEDVIDRAYDELFRFYEIVAQRDIAFLRNSGNILDNTGESAAFLIAGGYHTSHLTQLLRDQGYSYVVLTPFVEFETDHRQYEKVLLKTLEIAEAPDEPVAVTREADTENSDTVKIAGFASSSAVAASRLSGVSVYGISASRLTEAVAEDVLRNEQGSRLSIQDFDQKISSENFQMLPIGRPQSFLIDRQNQAVLTVVVNSGGATVLTLSSLNPDLVEELGFNIKTSDYQIQQSGAVVSDDGRTLTLQSSALPENSLFVIGRNSDLLINIQSTSKEKQGSGISGRHLTLRLNSAGTENASLKDGAFDGYGNPTASTNGTFAGSQPVQIRSQPIAQAPSALFKDNGEVISESDLDDFRALPGVSEDTLKILRKGQVADGRALTQDLVLKIYSNEKGLVLQQFRSTDTGLEPIGEIVRFKDASESGLILGRNLDQADYALQAPERFAQKLISRQALSLSRENQEWVLRSSARNQPYRLVDGEYERLAGSDDYLLGNGIAGQLLRLRLTIQVSPNSVRNLDISANEQHLFVTGLFDRNGNFVRPATRQEASDLRLSIEEGYIFYTVAFNRRVSKSKLDRLIDINTTARINGIEDTEGPVLSGLDGVNMKLLFDYELKPGHENTWNGSSIHEISASKQLRILDGGEELLNQSIGSLDLGEFGADGSFAVSSSESGEFLSPENMILLEQSSDSSNSYGARLAGQIFDPFSERRTAAKDFVDQLQTEFEGITDAEIFEALSASNRNIFDHIKARLNPALKRAIQIENRVSELAQVIAQKFDDGIRDGFFQDILRAQLAFPRLAELNKPFKTLQDYFRKYSEIMNAEVLHPLFDARIYAVVLDGYMAGRQGKLEMPNLVYLAHLRYLIEQAGPDYFDGAAEGARQNKLLALADSDLNSLAAWENGIREAGGIRYLTEDALKDLQKLLDRIKPEQYRTVAESQTAERIQTLQQSLRSSLNAELNLRKFNRDNSVSGLYVLNPADKTRTLRGEEVSAFMAVLYAVREYSQIEQDIQQKRPSSSVKAYHSLLGTYSPKLTPKIARAYLKLTAGAEGTRRLLRARKSIIDVLKSNILASVIALGGQTLEEKFGVDSSDNFRAFDSVFSGSKSQLLRQLFESLSLMPQEGDVLFFSRSDAERLGIRNIRSEGIALKLTEVTSGAVTAVLSDGKTEKLGAVVIQRSVLDPLITKDSFAGSQNQGSRLSTASINNDEEPSSNPEAGYSLLLEQARLRWGDSLNFSQSYLRVAANNLYAHLTQLGITGLDIAVIFLSLASSVRAKDVKAEKSVVGALLEPNILRILNNDLSKGYEVLLDALKASGKVQTEAAQRNQDLYRVSGRLYLKLIAEGLDASSIQDRFGELINRSVDNSSLVSNLNVSYYGFRNELQDQLILSGLSDSLPIAEVVDIPEAEVLPDSLPIAEVVDIPEAAKYVSGGRLALSGSEGEDGGIIPDSFFITFGVEGWNPEGVDLNSLLDEQAARTIALSELNIAVPITSTDTEILSVERNPQGLLARAGLAYNRLFERGAVSAIPSLSRTLSNPIASAVRAGILLGQAFTGLRDPLVIRVTRDILKRVKGLDNQPVNMGTLILIADGLNESGNILDVLENEEMRTQFLDALSTWQIGNSFAEAYKGRFVVQLAAPVRIEGESDSDYQARAAGYSQQIRPVLDLIKNQGFAVEITDVSKPATFIVPHNTAIGTEFDNGSNNRSLTSITAYPSTVTDTSTGEVELPDTTKSLVFGGAANLQAAARLAGNAQPFNQSAVSNLSALFGVNITDALEATQTSQYTLDVKTRLADFLFTIKTVWSDIKAQILQRAATVWAA